MKTSELIGAALDWAVAKCEQVTVLPKMRGGVYCTYRKGNLVLLAYSSDWAQGGPIIEREKIGLDYYPDGSHENGGEWGAAMSEGTVESFGHTPLIAFMRCYVTSKLGDEVAIPEELL